MSDERRLEYSAVKCRYGNEKLYIITINTRCI